MLVCQNVPDCLETALAEGDGSILNTSVRSATVVIYET